MMMMGERSLRVAWAMVQKKREAVILSRVCPGEGVLVLLFLCVIPCSSRSLLLCLCCNVLLLCILLAGRARCWLANCAGRVLHGSHCNALLSHYPLQERSPRVPPPPSAPPSLFHPCPSISPLPFSRCPSFLPAPLFTHTHTRRAEWIGLHLHFQNRWVQQKTADLSLSFPILCTHFLLSTAPSFLSHSPFRASLKP